MHPCRSHSDRGRPNARRAASSGRNHQPCWRLASCADGPSFCSKELANSRPFGVREFRRVSQTPTADRNSRSAKQAPAIRLTIGVGCRLCRRGGFFRFCRLLRKRKPGDKVLSCAVNARQLACCGNPKRLPAGVSEAFGPCLRAKVPDSSQHHH